MRSNLVLISIFFNLYAIDAQIAPDNWFFHYDKNPELGRSQVNALYTTKDSTVWVFNGTGVYEIPDHETAPVKLSDLKIYKPFIDSDGGIYYFKENVIYYIHVNDIKNTPKQLHKSREFILHVPENERTGPKKNLPSKIIINCLVTDKERNTILVGTDKCGLFSIPKPPPDNARPWQNYLRHYYNADNRKDTNSILLSNTIITFHRDKSNAIWIGFDNGLMKIKKGNPDIILRNIAIFNISERTKAGQIWVTGKDIALRKNVVAVFHLINDRYSDEPVLPPQPLWQSADKDFINAVLFDNAGDWWIAERAIYRGKAYGKLDIVNQVPDSLQLSLPNRFSIFEDFTSTQPLCMSLGKKGLIWIGTGDRGVFYIKKAPGINVEMNKVVRCHGEKNGQITVSAVEGKPPFTLVWRSNKNGKGMIPNFTRHQFPPTLSADTFQFWLTDRIETDTGYLPYKRLSNPPPVTAKIVEKWGPYFEDDCDGKVIAEASGGRVNPDILQKERYSFRWSNNKDPEYTNAQLPLGKFSVTVSDTMRCEFVLTDSLLLPLHFSAEAWDCQVVVKDKFNMFQVLFDVNNTEIKPEYIPLMEDIASWMQTYPSIKIEIGGHMNSSCKTCYKKSEDRAESAKKVLVAKGIAPDRIKTKGYAYDKPEFRNPAYDFKNQRIEIMVTHCDPIEIRNNCPKHKRKRCK